MGVNQYIFLSHLTCLEELGDRGRDGGRVAAGIGGCCCVHVVVRFVVNRRMDELDTEEYWL